MSPVARNLIEPARRVSNGHLDEPPLYDARLLTDSTGLARIELDGQVYTRRITRQRKLILTK